LAPASADHLLSTTSIVKRISYQSTKISYSTFDVASEELFRLTTKPNTVKANGKILKETTKENQEGWRWQTLHTGGVVRIKHSKENNIVIEK
jgi:hypothetical protein